MPHSNLGARACICSYAPVQVPTCIAFSFREELRHRSRSLFFEAGPTACPVLCHRTWSIAQVPISLMEGNRANTLCRNRKGGKEGRRERLRGTKLSLCRNALALLAHSISRKGGKMCGKSVCPSVGSRLFDPAAAPQPPLPRRCAPRSAPRRPSSTFISRARISSKVLFACTSVRPSVSPPPLPISSLLVVSQTPSAIFHSAPPLSVCSRIVNPSLEKVFSSPS